MLDAFATWLSFDLLGFTAQTRLGEAIHFFLYVTPKVQFLLVSMVFLMGMVHSWFSPGRTHAWLAGKPLGQGNAMAARLGIVTPFCSCSGCPSVHRFPLRRRVLSVTFSFVLNAVL